MAGIRMGLYSLTSFPLSRSGNAMMNTDPASTESTMVVSMTAKSEPAKSEPAVGIGAGPNEVARAVSSQTGKARPSDRMSAEEGESA